MSTPKTLATLAVALACGCSSTIPEDILGYESDCRRMNPAPIPPTTATRTAA